MGKKSKRKAAGEVALISSELQPAQQEAGALIEHEPATMLPGKPSEQYISMIQGLVANPEIKVEVLDRLWEMHKEASDRDARMAYAEAKARAQKNMPPSIASNKENRHTDSKYSDLSAVNTEVVPVYAAEGFSLSFKTRESEVAGDLILVGTLLHEGGHSEEYPLPLPLDDKGSGGTTNKTQIQARKSTYQYCQRILVCQIWNIATGHDKDGNSSKPVDQQPETVSSPYPKEEFDKNYIKAAELVTKGMRTADDMKSVYESRAIANNLYLTKKQLKKIEALRKLEKTADE